MDKTVYTNLSSKTKRNIICGCVIYFCVYPEIVMAIWSYFARGELGFTQTQALLLAWGIFIVTILSEIPTGIFADKFSRKTSVVFGASLILIAKLSWVTFDSFWIIAIAQIIGGVGGSFASGAYDAIVHDTIAADVGAVNNEAVERIYSKYLGKKNAAFFAARVSLGLLGAWLFTINVYLPYWGAFLMVIVALIAGLLMHEEKIDRSENKQYLKEAIKHIQNNTSIPILVFIGINYLVVGDLIYSQIQPYGTLINLSVITVGILFATHSIMAVVTSLLYRKINQKILANTISFIFSVLCMLIILLLLTKNIYAAFISMLLLGCIGGIMFPMYNNEVMKNVPEKIKATVLSVNSFLLFLPAIIAAILASLLIDNFGTSDSFIYFSWIAIILFPVSIFSFILSIRKAKINN